MEQSGLLVYAVKLSLCATLCYVIYNALAWPGISTATLTVLIAGLSTTGATYQRMLFRILGSAVGAVILGIGCIIFVFPYADTAIPFLVAVACVSFIGAWIARSPHFGYVGLQIVFSFYLIAFEGFSAPTLMTPARDRLIGIFLALIVMWAIFHQLHPEKTVDKMRHGLARLLTIEAEVMDLLRTARFDSVPALREEADEIVGTIRAFAEVIPYELDRHIAKDQAISEQIQNAISTTGSVFLMALTWPRTSESSDWDKIAGYPHAVLEQGLRNLSRLLEGATISAESEEFKPELPDTTFYGPWPEPIQNTLNVYAELQKQCREIAIGSAIGDFQVCKGNSTGRESASLNKMLGRLPFVTTCRRASWSPGSMNRSGQFATASSMWRSSMINHSPGRWSLSRPLANSLYCGLRRDCARGFRIRPGEQCRARRCPGGLWRASPTWMW